LTWMIDDMKALFPLGLLGVASLLDAECDKEKGAAGK